MQAEISSRKPWNDTGIELVQGNTYAFHANGTWTDFFKRTGPGGFSNRHMKCFEEKRRSPNHNWFCLMGVIDKDMDTCFEIGLSTEKRVEKSGRLWCFANDVRGFYWNNFGKISLAIEEIS